MHQRGADHLEGGDAVAERGAADGQPRAAGQGRRAVALQQRHEEPAQQHATSRRCFSTASSSAPLHDADDADHQADPRRRRPPHHRPRLATSTTRSSPTTRARCCARWSSRRSRSRTRDGRWFTVRIMPYRTLENVIDGVVITFTDATAARSARSRAARASDQLDAPARRVAAGPRLERAPRRRLGLPRAPMGQLHRASRRRSRSAIAGSSRSIPTIARMPAREWAVAIRSGTPARRGVPPPDRRAANYRWFKTRAVPIRDERRRGRQVVRHQHRRRRPQGVAG